jgi:hypothetical protein
VLLGKTAEKLKEAGIQTVAVVATNAQRARLFFRFRPVRFPVGADPDLITHRAYGLPQMAVTPELMQAIDAVSADLARELRLNVPAGGALAAIEGLDGYARTEADEADFQRHQAQLVGQFLVDGKGIVRWTNIECQRDGLAGIDKFPTDEELLTVAQTLLG